MDIESLSVSKINTMIGQCSHLKAHISTNDKTPFTDGYIDLYSALRQGKADWIGRVPVQVKGRSLQLKEGSSPKHLIDRVDLLAYQRDAGVLFFFVAVDPAAACRPYYNLLSPFTIQAILDDAPSDRPKVSVPLTELPDDPSSIEHLVALALKTRDQNMSLGFDPVLFERAQSFTVHTATGLDLDAPVSLTPGINDFALVLHTTDGLSVPLGGAIRILPQDYIEKHIDLQIRSGPIAYQGSTVRRIDGESFELKVSEGLKFVYRSSSGKHSAQVSLTLEKTLAGRLKSIEFYLALVDTQVIEFNGNPSPFEIPTRDEDAELRRHLKTLRALSDLFEHLGVDTHLVDMSQIDEIQTRQLNAMHRAFVQGEEVTDATAETSRVIQQVGPSNLMFVISPGSAPDKWRLVDPFSAETRHQLRWSTDDESGRESIPVTAYDIVEPEYLGTVLNMRLDAIVGAYEAIAEFPSTYVLANERMLALITASDSSKLLKEELLGAAEALNDWLIVEQGEQPHHLINRWQISARRGGLSTDERNAIRQLKRTIARSDAERARQQELACAILLGDEGEVTDLLRDLPDDQLREMQTWPIWTLRGARSG